MSVGNLAANEKPEGLHVWKPAEKPEASPQLCAPEGHVNSCWPWRNPKSGSSISFPSVHRRGCAQEVA